MLQIEAGSAGADTGKELPGQRGLPHLPRPDDGDHRELPQQALHAPHMPRPLDHVRE
jgi:hypothetical protein